MYGILDLPICSSRCPWFENIQESLAAELIWGNFWNEKHNNADKKKNAGKMAAKSWEVAWSPHNPDEFIRYCNDIFLYRIIRDEVSNLALFSFEFWHFVCGHFWKPTSTSQCFDLKFVLFRPIIVVCLRVCISCEEAGIMFFWSGKLNLMIRTVKCIQNKKGFCFKQAQVQKQWNTPHTSRGS